jgi:ABC-type oligopeptide transport system ATPase subunit
MTALLEVAGLKKLFPVGRGRLLHALDGVDLTLAEGGSLGIVGESGSGKSTLAQLVVRLADPSEGMILRWPRHRRRAAGTLRARSAAAVAPARLPERRRSAQPAFSTARNNLSGSGRHSSTRPRAGVAAIAEEVGLGRASATPPPSALRWPAGARSGSRRR